MFTVTFTSERTEDLLSKIRRWQLSGDVDGGIAIKSIIFDYPRIEEVLVRAIVVYSITQEKVN